MAASTNAALYFFLFLLPLSINAATFQIVNGCSFTVWGAWTTTGPRAGGGNQLNPGQSWTININASTTGGRIWARTGCALDGSGRGNCQTGDCGGVLQCQGYGRPPNTVAEFALNQFDNLDFFDISNVDGYNVGLDFSPTTGGCRGIRCSANIVGECPAVLRATGGCNNPCTVFGTQQYCCTNGTCGPTDYSKFFKTRCPDAYSYPKDDQTSTFTCPGGNNYRVTFCPGDDTGSERRVPSPSMSPIVDYPDYPGDDPTIMHDNPTIMNDNIKLTVSIILRQ